MPRPRPPNLQRQITQHGKAVWYVRIGRGPRTRIRAPFGTPEFDAEYRAALAGKPRPAKAGATAGTLAWLIERYRETTAWTDLSLATRRNRENHFKKVIETAGHQSIRAIATDAPLRQHKPAISSMRCAASSTGRRTQSTSPSIRPLASEIRSGGRVLVFQYGRRLMPTLMNGAGR